MVTEQDLIDAGMNPNAGGAGGDVPASLIQKTAVEGIDMYDIKVYNASKEKGKVQARGVRTVPTTIALDDNYEIERREVPTHVDEICTVLDSWLG